MLKNLCKRVNYEFQVRVIHEQKNLLDGKIFSVKTFRLHTGNMTTKANKTRRKEYG